MPLATGGHTPGPPGGERPGFKLSVVVPVYNERYLVAEALRRVLAGDVEGVRELEVVVVDDGSTDGTAAILDGLAAHEPRVRLLRHPRNRGKGAALRTAIAATSGDLVLFQDADLEYDPRDYGRLVRPFLEDGADVVYGSRFLVSGRRRVLHYRHALLNRALTSLSNLATDLTLTDLETCYKVFRAPLLKSIPLRSDDFAIEAEITAKIAKRHCRLFEVPVSYLGRTYREGKKIRWRDGARALRAILRYWAIDDLYREDEYGAQMLRRLDRTPRFNRWLADTLRPMAGDAVLELGAGIGSLTTWMLPRELYVAAETNSHFLDYLRNFAMGRPYLTVERIDPADPVSLEAWRERFDTVLCLGVLERVESPRAVLENLGRALRPGGTVVLYVAQGPRLLSTLDTALAYRRRYDRDALERDLAAAGFRVEVVRHFNRAARPGWWWHGRLLRRRSFTRFELKLYDVAIPLLRRLDRLLPWPGLSWVVVARKGEPQGRAGVSPGAPGTAGAARSAC